jgi:hypothetical protein
MVNLQFSIANLCLRVQRYGFLYRGAILTFQYFEVKGYRLLAIGYWLLAIENGARCEKVSCAIFRIGLISSSPRGGWVGASGYSFHLVTFQNKTKRKGGGGNMKGRNKKNRKDGVSSFRTLVGMYAPTFILMCTGRRGWILPRR